MAVQNVDAAALFSDSYLAEAGLTRHWVMTFYSTWLPDEWRSTDPGYVSPLLDDNEVYVAAIEDIQRFVFGDEGDAAIGVDPRPATEEEVDGHLGSMTERRMLAWIGFESPAEPVPIVAEKDYLLVCGEPVYVDGGVVISSLDENPDHDMCKVTKDRYGKIKGSSAWPKPIAELLHKHKKYARMLSAGHWDVCSSAGKAFKILCLRKLASAGGFDNPRPSDGKSVFYQWLDPGLRYGYHGSELNKRSFFSYDLSNSVSLKYARRYEQRVGIPRPRLRIDKYGKLGEGKGFLGMYRAQIHSLLYVLKALAEYTKLPLIFPHLPGVGQGHVSLKKGIGHLWKDGFNGCVTHRDLPMLFNRKHTKWDVRGLQEQIVALLLLGEIPMEDFPSLVEDWRLHDEGWGEWLEAFQEACIWEELKETA